MANPDWTTDETPYHNLDRPVLGGDYYESWNEIVSLLDRELIKSGTLENRPSDPEPGRWYAVTNPGQEGLWRYDGNEWRDFTSGGGGGGSGGGMTIGQILAKSPNMTVEDTELQNGSSLTYRIPVRPNQTLTVYNWGVVDYQGETPGGLLVELRDPSGNVVEDANRAEQSDTNGVASWENNGSSEQVATLAVSNQTGNDYIASNEESVSARFGYEVS